MNRNFLNTDNKFLKGGPGSGEGTTLLARVRGKDNIETQKKSIGTDSNDFVIALGSTIKSISLDGNDGKIGSYSILFTGADNQDFHGNNFTKNTYLGKHRGDGMDVTFNHRMPLFNLKGMEPEVAEFAKAMQDRVMKNPVHTRIDEVGVFSELVCDLSDKYEKAVYDLASAGKLKWSSATAPHLFKAKKNGELEMFVIAEQALTPIPAEYKMIEHKAMPMKAFLDFMKGGPGSGESEGHPFRGNQYTNNGGGSPEPRHLAEDKRMSDLESRLDKAGKLLDDRNLTRAYEEISNGSEDLDYLINNAIDEDVEADLERYLNGVEIKLDQADEYLRSGDNRRAYDHLYEANNILANAFSYAERNL